MSLHLVVHYDETVGTLYSSRKTQTNQRLTEMRLMRNPVAKLTKDLLCVVALECLVHWNDLTQVGHNELTLNSLNPGRGDVVLCILM